MPLDAFANGAYSLVATAPTPADSGLSLVVTAGQGSRFPAAPCNAVVWPADSIATAGNLEIVRVTAVVVDTLTIVRAQEGTSARAIVVGDQIAATITAGMLSTLETDISVVSAAAALADTHAATASAAATSADAHAGTASAVAAAASALATAADTRAGTASAAATAADTHAATASAAAASADAHANAVSILANAISVVAAVEILDRISADNALSGVVSALEVRVSALSGAAGGGSVTSTELGLVSAQAASALAFRAPWLAGVMKVVSNTQSVAASALTGLSGLILTVAPGERWQFEGMTIMSTSAIAAGCRFGMSVAGGLAAAPRYMYAETRAAGALNAQSAVGAIGGFGLLAASGNTTILSATSVASVGAVFPIRFCGVVQASAQTTITLAAAVIASATASPLHILAGSFLKAFRVT